MTDALSPNTKAILMLTAPLVAGRSGKTSGLLTPSEYKRLAKRLLELRAKPADLLTTAADQLLGDCNGLLDKTRLQRLLARGFLLSQAVERWHARAIWVVSRADGTYPQRLKTRLREDAPPILYGCGDRSILESGGLAVVGSRNVADALIEYTKAVGRLAASAGRTLVSGGARGIDQAAMRGALEAGGRVTGVLADSLEKSAMQREHRNMLLEGQLVLVSPYDPSSGFNVGQAMQRNKLVYALADAALVVSADRGKGGTWSGAIEQLEKLHLVPVFVRTKAGSSAGLSALAEKGALAWPEPTDAEGLAAAIARPVPEQPAAGEWQISLLPSRERATEVREAATRTSSTPARRPLADPSRLSVAEDLFSTVRSLVIQLVQGPTKAADIACGLGVTGPQAQKWLKRLVAEGVLEKNKKGATYSIAQARLFDMEAAGDPETRNRPTSADQ